MDGAVLSTTGASLICELSDVEEFYVLICSHNESMGLRGRNVSGTLVYKRCN